MTKRARILVAAVIGLALGAALGWFAGWVARSDNVPFFVALGALAGLWGSLAWARVVRPLVLGAIGLLALALLVVVFTPPRARFQGLTPAPTPAPTAGAAATAAGRWPDPDQVATLSSLQRVDDYPLYTMRYSAGRPAGSWNAFSRFDRKPAGNRLNVGTRPVHVGLLPLRRTGRSREPALWPQLRLALQPRAAAFHTQAGGRLRVGLDGGHRLSRLWGWDARPDDAAAGRAPPPARCAVLAVRRHERGGRRGGHGSRSPGRRTA